MLAALILASGSGGLIYVGLGRLSGRQHARKAKAAGFDQAISAVRKFAGEVADEAEAGAKNFWHWLGVELDTAHKALIADWEKLEILLTKKPARPAKSGPNRSSGRNTKLRTRKPSTRKTLSCLYPKSGLCGARSDGKEQALAAWGAWRHPAAGSRAAHAARGFAGN